MITVAWDVDDILNNLMFDWFTKKWLVEHRDCKIKFEQLTDNPPHQILQIEESEYLKSLDDYRLSDNYINSIPNSEILQWFEKYGAYARHLAVTAVPLKAAHISAFWVIRHFGKWIRSFNFLPSKRSNEDTTEYYHNKNDYLNTLKKIDILIEDNQMNIIEPQKNGIKCFLVEKPWNNGKLTVTEILNELNRIVAND